jgi:molecular chaperone GrpE (heat shock protein)
VSGHPALAVVRQQAQDLLRLLAAERKRADSHRQRSQAELHAVVLAAVEGIEALALLVQALGDALPEEPARSLRIAAEGAWERLELAGVVRDGALGESLDVARHKVVKRRTTDSVPPNTVVQVLSPGIVFAKERLREAAVVVSRREGGHAANRD